LSSACRSNCRPSDGPGFALGEESRVFEPIYRGRGQAQSNSTSGADHDRTSPQGVGLGLSLVRRIAEAHGGRAYATNRKGGGALVVMELPSASG